MSAGEYLENITYQGLLDEKLELVSDSLDKREGSIIFDAMAPNSYEQFNYYMKLRQNYKDTYVLTAKEEYLDFKMVEQGLTRYQATYAIKRADFATESGVPMVIPLGARFSIISETEIINYKVIAVYLDIYDDTIQGAYQLECETAGTAGNSYTGNLFSIDYIHGLASAIMSTLIKPARDVETDDEALIRYLQAVNISPFGGNVAQYDEAVKAIDGVGELQVYSTWDKSNGKEGGGTVKLSIIDAEHNPISLDFINIIENLVDPENAQGVKGTGLGMAPIGHFVTITTPTVLPINIETNITLSTGFAISQVESKINEFIEKYLLILRKQWGIADMSNRYSLSIFIAQINTAILGVDGIVNVTNTKLNGVSLDIVLQENELVQELPMIGVVTLHAN